MPDKLAESLSAASLTLKEDALAPRILTIDIETSPNIIDAWGLWDINASLNQIHEVSRVICFAAKWYDAKTVIFSSEYHTDHAAMILAAYALINEADIVVHFNGVSFDMKHLHREFLLAGLAPPAPYKDVDLLRVAKTRFKFVSNKLDHIAPQLGLGKKTTHTGHQLWRDCLHGDDATKAKAWRLMRRYNKQDVLLTEALYDRLRGWIPNHPHPGIWTGEIMSCANCGGTNLARDGMAPALLGAYGRHQCRDCGAWSRDADRSNSVKMRGIK